MRERQSPIKLRIVMTTTGFRNGASESGLSRPAEEPRGM